MDHSMALSSPHLFVSTAPTQQGPSNNPEPLRASTAFRHSLPIVPNRVSVGSWSAISLRNIDSTSPRSARLSSSEVISVTPGYTTELYAQLLDQYSLTTAIYMGPVSPNTSSDLFIKKYISMSGPRPKRQFAGAASDPAQRQITSFFTTNTVTSSSSPHNNFLSQTLSLPSTTRHADSAIHLPASVQANLLSVGMRIRKSVPEGYKTGDYSAFALWDENDACPSAAATIGEGQRSRANAFSSPRELLPFCGIHKVGGLDTQPEDHRYLPSMPNTSTSLSMTPPCQPSFPVEGTDKYEHMVGLNTSSISLASGTPGTQTRKRSFVEEEESESPKQLNLWPHNHDISVSPRSLVPMSWDSNGRIMAVPRKGGLRGKNTGATMAMPGAGQENAFMVVNSDFEEAEFLDRGTWEVNMIDA